MELPQTLANQLMGTVLDELLPSKLYDPNTDGIPRWRLAPRFDRTLEDAPKPAPYFGGIEVSQGTKLYHTTITNPAIDAGTHKVLIDYPVYIHRWTTSLQPISHKQLHDLRNGCLDVVQPHVDAMVAYKLKAFKQTLHSLDSASYPTLAGDICPVAACNRWRRVPGLDTHLIGVLGGTHYVMDRGEVLFTSSCQDSDDGVDWRPQSSLYLSHICGWTVAAASSKGHEVYAIRPGEVW